ncbi:MAG: aminotransferase class V-fold PLP-dependent enzyme [Syntrophomonadaceae bacterium]|jgi:cysteine desulfurase family protein|nr:aminotransferase class V-fold PLP-dependent enzyme [Syntrophomonadaceae bacterium]
MKTIYMDNAATSYPKPETVYQAIDNFNRNIGANPGRGSNQQSLKSGSILVEAREALASLFNIADSNQIAFMANITEAINVGLKGILKKGDHVITTSMEHNSIARPLYAMTEQGGVEWTAVPCAPDGSLDPQNIKQVIKPHTKMICMLHASNLTGTIMPIEQVGQIASDHGVLFMVDSAQSAGVLPIDVERHNIDLLAFTGHKSLLGPQGTGGLYIKPGIDIRPLKEGGTGSLSEHLAHPGMMPDLLESGTHNTPGIAGLLAGVEFINQTGINVIEEHEAAMTELLLSGLDAIKGLTVYGPRDIKRQTAVVAFNIDGIDCGAVSMMLDYEYGIITRAGTHCTPMAHKTIGTLELGACRLSPGFFTTPEEIQAVIKAIATIAARN